MKRSGIRFELPAILAGSILISVALATVPTEIQQPGTQPLQIGALESANRCDNCHAGYNANNEPSTTWRGGMMANAGRDPIFWATMAVAEQDFPGAGDLCLRCHATSGWLGGRSEPTDGSGLLATDSDGVDCDTCHKMTNPDFSEHQGAMTEPFVANDGGAPAKGYYGSGMLSMWPGGEKLGPYAQSDARHTFLGSLFHRDVNYCGSCHDVSNPAVGDLAPGNGKQPTGDSVIFSGVLGSALNGKAAFNNFPFMYGIVERTYSEHMASAFPATNVSQYGSLPADLKKGAIKAAYDNSIVANTGGNYQDGTARKFSCQTCHMPPVNGEGCNKAGVMIRKDLPLHDQTGGNSWGPDVILYQNSHGTLRLGGGMTTAQINATLAGKERARQELQRAASLTVSGNVLRVTNLTGHKLISGYPEGRRMWINVKWYSGASETLVREDGAYGSIIANVNGFPTSVETILNPDDPNTKVYEAHMGLTKSWATQLVGLGYPANLPLKYDRETGNPTLTLGQLATSPSLDAAETFRFVLNNVVLKDNRIPPYGMAYDEARRRNVLPVPANQYGAPTSGGTYRHWDEITLNPPANATYAKISLMYQGTSWEYIQFLLLANTGASAFLANEGQNLFDAWLNTGMARPVAMATAQWGLAAAPVAPPTPTVSGTPGSRLANLSWTVPTNRKGPFTGFRVYYDQGGKQVFRASVASTGTTFQDTSLGTKFTYTYVVRTWRDANANGVYDEGVDFLGAPSNRVYVTTL